MPFSSPTTTSAVNEKRRPPLTTLATRLISTTRSCRSRPVADTDRSGAAMSSFEVAVLEVQAALAGALGERLHAAVVLVAAAVEHGGLDAGGLRALGQQLAGALGLLERLERAQVGLGPVDGGQRAAGVVVDELGEDARGWSGRREMRGRSAEPRTFARTRRRRLRRRAGAVRTVMRACPPSGRRTRPGSGCPCPCRAPAAAACG